jgi:hypothetical protein
VWYFDCTCGFHELAGLTYNRFHTLSINLTIGIQSEDAPQDPFHSVRPLIEAFNVNNFQNFIAGSSIEVDESTSAWRGKNARKRPSGAPGVIMQKGKPESIGLQFWTASDCSTGLILNIELNEGKQRNVSLSETVIRINKR